MDYTHRIAWEEANGPIPEGLHVLHSCDNPPCCNVGHLFLGTAQDNADDKVAKGRQLQGERHPGAKLTWGQVEAIRSDDRRNTVIAGEHGVTNQLISMIKRREIWAQ